MRTTVMFDPNLMRAAKARSAERGESLKTLFSRALAAELALPQAEPRRAKVRLPLFGAPAGPLVTLSNSDLEQALAGADAEALGLPARTTPARRRVRR